MEGRDVNLIRARVQNFKRVECPIGVCDCPMPASRSPSGARKQLRPASELQLVELVPPPRQSATIPCNARNHSVLAPAARSRVQLVRAYADQDDAAVTIGEGGHIFGELESLRRVV
jgi:hypothetical protein